MSESIDDRIDAWHNAPEGSEAASMPLWEWLGMTEGQYRKWAADEVTRLGEEIGD